MSSYVAVAFVCRDHGVKVQRRVGEGMHRRLGNSVCAEAARRGRQAGRR